MAGAVIKSLPRVMTGSNARANIVDMAANTSGNPGTHFGRQMRKERIARGWSLREMAARSGISFAHLSMIETGKRPPTEKIARACDRVFPERKGWCAPRSALLYCP
jgi:ribosome-binding protein aMBF1 (putative translation factor)